MPRLRLPPDRTADDRTAEVDAKTRKQRRMLWEALNEYITRNGGFVVSIPGAKQMRIEIDETSDLAGRLAETGHRMQYCGVGVRITGMSPDAFLNVSIYEIVLP